MGEKAGEKEDHNVYLFSWQFQALDRIAEERGVSRNQVLRDILSRELEEEGQE
ncbi:MAG: ribbon-helix-helix protein, CopG family [Candidatus Nanohaloarchaea archaeon]